MWLVLMLKKAENIFEAAGPVKLLVVPQPGDPMGFCPVFSTLEEAKAAYPNAEVLEMREGRQND